MLRVWRGTVCNMAPEQLHCSVAVLAAKISISVSKGVLNTPFTSKKALVATALFQTATLHHTLVDLVSFAAILRSYRFS
jgi:hypothetical protein